MNRSRLLLSLFPLFVAAALACDSAGAQPTSSVLFEKVWTHTGPNYSDDLYFSGSGIERSVKGLPLPLPQERYAASCGENNIRVSCEVRHIAGGGHCEFVAWADPNDSTDCGCIGHVGANVTELNQKCEIVVTVRHQTISQASIIPNYVVDTVVYAPPGSAGKGTPSTIEYATGSKAGTAVSLAKSFKGGVSVKASVNVGVASFDGSFEASASSKNQSSVELKKSTTDTIKVSGSNADGIDHNRDMIYLTLRPHITATVDGDNVAYSIQRGPNTQSRFVYVGWLKNEAEFVRAAKDTHDALASAGVTAAEYATILARDPFATGQGDRSNRFTLLRTLPYEPPYSQGDATQPYSFQQANEATASDSSTLEDQYSVSASISGSLGIAKLSVGGSVTWGSSSTSLSTTTGAQTATVTVGGPSYGYAGSQLISVYWDNIYGAFMFRDDEGQDVAHDVVVLSGAVTERGAMAAHRPIELRTGGRVYRSLTNSRGRYKFRGQFAGAGTVVVSGVMKSVKMGSTPTLDIQL
jgi:hypothetical protein